MLNTLIKNTNSRARISIIVAMSTNQVIGVANRLPWHLPADLKHFKALTWGKPIIMGRKTYESIGKPLPGRHNIIVSHNRELQITGCDIVTSLEEAIKLPDSASEVMIIGGAQLFKSAIPYVDYLYLTLIHKKFAGDCFLPEEMQVMNPAFWRQVKCERHPRDEQNLYDYSFLEYDKVN